MSSPSCSETGAGDAIGSGKTSDRVDGEALRGFYAQTCDLHRRRVSASGLSLANLAMNSSRLHDRIGVASEGVTTAFGDGAFLCESRPLLQHQCAGWGLAQRTKRRQSAERGDGTARSAFLPRKQVVLRKHSGTAWRLLCIRLTYRVEPWQTEGRSCERAGSWINTCRGGCRDASVCPREWAVVRPRALAQLAQRRHPCYSSGVDVSEKLDVLAVHLSHAATCIIPLSGSDITTVSLRE